MLRKRGSNTVCDESYISPKMTANDDVHGDFGGGAAAGGGGVAAEGWRHGVGERPLVATPKSREE
jgi:hypothetical protein